MKLEESLPKSPALEVEHVDGSHPATEWTTRAGYRIKASGMLPALVLLFVVGRVLSPVFLSTTNIENVLRLSAVLGLIAIGQTFVILSGGGGIDLSVAAVAAAAGVVGAQFGDHGLAVVIITSVLAGAFFGLVNGLGVTTARLQPFIITLATLTIARGVGFELTDARPVVLDTPGLSTLSRGNVGPIPVPIVIFGVALVLGQVVLSRTVFGRNLYAVGGNDEAAFGSGVSVRAYRLAVYIISGVLAGAAGVLGMAQLNTADPNFGRGMELDAIAAVVVGGAVLSGGRGTILGTGMGVLIMSFVSNLLNLKNVNPWMNLMVTGLIVIVVVSLNAQHEPGAERTRLWQAWPLYSAIAVGAFFVFVVLQ